jgi:multiple sugar transport system permease protein
MEDGAEMKTDANQLYSKPQLTTESERHASSLLGKIVLKALFYGLVLLVILFFAVPIYWVVSTSFKSNIDMIAMPPKLVFKPVFDYYQTVLQDSAVLRGFLNSIITTFSALIISMIIGLPTAYVMARYNFWWKKAFLMWILVGLMVPMISFIVPFYVIFQQFGMLDSIYGMIFVYLLADIPFVVWMMGVFFKEIPVELDESAKIDGCSTLQIIIKVLLPISKPGLAAASISCVIATWNEFLFALILTQTNAKTAPVVIVGYMSTSGMRWGEMAAISVILMIPPIIFGVAIQKYYIRGLTAGSVKM